MKNAVALLSPCAAILMVGCSTPRPSLNDGLTQNNAEMRLSEVRRLATEHASQPGLDASFQSREIKSHQVVMRNCVVTFTQDGTTVAAGEATIKDGKFSFKGSPVLKTPSTVKLGDQEIVITAEPKDGNHYEVTPVGKMASFGG